MISAADFWQYAGVFFALVVSAFGAPIPEELPIATGGVLVGQDWGKDDGLKWWIMLPLCISGVVLCDTILYLVGRKWGSWLVERQWVQRRLLPPEKRARIEKNFEDYGIGILLVARLMPGIRTPVFITAGMTKLSFRKFLFADGLYAIPGVNFFFWMAYWFTDSFMEILHKLEDYRQLVVVAVVSFIAGFVAAYFMQRRVSTGDPKEIPIVGKTMASISHHLHEGSKPEISIVPVPLQGATALEYPKHALIVATNAAIVVVQFTEQDDKVQYRFRCMKLGVKTEETGEGLLWEATPTLAAQTTLDTGAVRTTWAKGPAGRGLIMYDPETMRVYLADRAHFETLDLTRFVK